MRLKSCLIKLQYWIFIASMGGVVLSAKCVPTGDDLRLAVQSNVLGTATAVIDAAFILAAQALLNPINAITN